jgi:hypothetical protein
MVADMPKAEIVMPEKDARSTRITTTTNIEEKVSLEMKKVEIPYIAKATLSGKDMAKWIIKTSGVKAPEGAEKIRYIGVAAYNPTNKAVYINHGNGFKKEDLPIRAALSGALERDADNLYANESISFPVKGIASADIPVQKTFRTVTITRLEKEKTESSEVKRTTGGAPGTPSWLKELERLGITNYLNSASTSHFPASHSPSIIAPDYVYRTAKNRRTARIHFKAGLDADLGYRLEAGVAADIGTWRDFTALLRPSRYSNPRDQGQVLCWSRERNWNEDWTIPSKVLAGEVVIIGGTAYAVSEIAGNKGHRGNKGNYETSSASSSLANNGTANGGENNAPCNNRGSGVAPVIPGTPPAQDQPPAVPPVTPPQEPSPEVPPVTPDTNQ